MFDLGIHLFFHRPLRSSRKGPQYHLPELRGRRKESFVSFVHILDEKFTIWTEPSPDGRLRKMA